MSTHAPPARTKVTTHTLQSKKAEGEVITMLTAYDYATSLAVDQAGIDSILVGDSLGMVVLGYDSTLPVTMDDMLHHCKAVARGAQYPLLIGDMPFMSYQASIEAAVRNAGRFLAEAGMDAVKLEGGRDVIPATRAIIAAGIPVMGHVGLTPQSINHLGGYKVQGRTALTARRLIDDAIALAETGCFALVLEAVPGRVARLISERIDIPTVGIGAGAGCDGQVLVTHDLLGMFDRFTPRFVKRYADLHGVMVAALSVFRTDVSSGVFPAQEHTFTIPDDEWGQLLEDLGPP